MPSQNVEKLKNEIREVRLLLDGLTAYEEIPGPIIELAISKTDQLKSLLQNLKDESSVPPPELKAEIKPITEEEKSPVKEERSAVEKVIDTTETEVESRVVFEEEKVEEKEPGARENNPPQLVNEEKKPQPEIETPQQIEAPKKEDNPIKVNETKTEPVSQNHKIVLGDTIGGNKKVMNDIIGDTGNHTLGKRIESSAINDLKRAIPINDRFRFQRELFGNNVTLFNETLAKLDTMINFEDAKEFLLKEFKWDDKLDSTHDFFVLLGRRFVK